MLGKLENNGPRYGMSFEQLIAFANGAGAYLIKHRENQTGFIHPTHFTPEEKVERRKAKAKKAREKAKAEKAKSK